MRSLPLMVAVTLLSSCTVGDDGPLDASEVTEIEGKRVFGPFLYQSAAVSGCLQVGRNGDVRFAPCGSDSALENVQTRRDGLLVTFFRNRDNQCMARAGGSVVARECDFKRDPDQRWMLHWRHGTDWVIAVPRRDPIGSANWQCLRPASTTVVVDRCGGNLFDLPASRVWTLGFL